MPGILDSHLHLWDPDRFSYPWLGSHPCLNHPFLPADFQAATEGLDITGMVFVQCDCLPEQSIAEADWVCGLAATEPRILGIVAHASLETGARVRPHLRELARRPLVRGIRRLLQGEDRSGFCLDDDFITGVRSLEEHGFVCDLCVRHQQIGDIITLVRQVPGVRFVLDHLGKPGIRAAQWDPWSDDIRRLADLPNVWCKLSGLVTEADLESWQPSQLQPYISHAIGCFAPGRLLFGGDWPVVTLGASYRRWVEVVDQAISGLTEVARRGILGGNAQDVYRLASPGTR